LRRSRPTHGCRAKDYDNDDDDDDDVLLAILISYKHKLVRIYAVSTALTSIIPLKAELNPICHFLALLEAHHILHVSRISVKRAKFSLPSSASILIEQRSFQNGGDVYCDVLG
jgi:hypothetical protein